MGRPLLNGLHRVRAVAFVAAPRAVAFARFTDHASWSEWAGLGPVRLERRGEPHRDGAGAVRVFPRAGTAEEVTGYEAPERLDYRLLRGFPLRNHRGRVDFADAPGGTLITWRCQFRAGPTGPVLRLFVAALFRVVLRRLAGDLRRRQLSSMVPAR
ncbi:MAG: SRPBCC family protein [Actinomycetota bacterium]